MFKKFDRKKFIIRVAISWTCFFFLLGFVRGFAQGNVWTYFGDSKNNNVQFYVMKNNIELNAEGNYLLYTKSESEFGTGYYQWEFDCQKKTVRMVQKGSSFNKMQKTGDDWEEPNPTSFVGVLLKRLCISEGD